MGRLWRDGGPEGRCQRGGSRGLEREGPGPADQDAREADARPREKPRIREGSPGSRPAGVAPRAGLRRAGHRQRGADPDRRPVSVRVVRGRSVPIVRHRPCSGPKPLTPAESVGFRYTRPIYSG